MNNNVLTLGVCVLVVVYNVLKERSCRKKSLLPPIDDDDDWLLV